MRAHWIDANARARAAFHHAQVLGARECVRDRGGKLFFSPRLGISIEIPRRSIEQQYRHIELYRSVEDAVLARIQAVLEQGGAARSVDITAEEEGMIKPLGLLTAKPIIYATNVSEDDLADGNDTALK